MHIARAEWYELREKEEREIARKMEWDPVYAVRVLAERMHPGERRGSGGGAQAARARADGRTAGDARWQEVRWPGAEVAGSGGERGRREPRPLPLVILPLTFARTS